MVIAISFAKIFFDFWVPLQCWGIGVAFFLLLRVMATKPAILHLVYKCKTQMLLSFEVYNKEKRRAKV
jgi:hypothetical protein